MNKTEFIQLIQTPDLPAAKHVAALKQVVADFPYFTVSQVLLAKALFNEKHYEYEKYLKQIALAVPDREVLYHYLHNLKLEHNTSFVPNPVQETTPKLNLPVEPVIIEPAITKQQTEVELNEAEIAKDDVEELTEPVNEGVEPTDNQITEPVVAIEDEPVSLLREPDTTSNELPVSSGLSYAGEEYSFMEWLQRTQFKPGKPLTEPKTEIIPVQPESKPVASEPIIAEVTKYDIEEAVAKSNINDFGNILDKFIKENPSISRPKAEFFNPVNMARQSVEEDEDLVTETLANLLYRQGNLKKAIRAYEKLCLLYPGKMTYFASLIQKIKTELKD